MDQDTRPVTKWFRFTGLLTERAWLSPGWVGVDELGMVVAVSDIPPETNASDVSCERIDGYALPGMPNAHSHAFQYAMAGHAEYLPIDAGSDDFWSWREAMYELALTCSPEQVEAIATILYAEMVRCGFTSVAEFHYLHHDQDGTPYVHRAEMGERLCRAAETAGIALTLIPIFYQRGGFGMPASARQRRFLSPDLDAYVQLVEATQQCASSYQRVNVGIGVHSLRAVEAPDVVACFGHWSGEVPKHIHVSEQTKEVEQCISAYGARPVAWLLENVPLDASYHLVHATHIDEAEVVGIAASGAHVVLCPTTEGNLGDGLFPLRAFCEAGGKWSIGTDSHVGVRPFEELRLLDYGQRLYHRKRNVLCLSPGEDSGQVAFSQALSGGRAAVGEISDGSYFAMGCPFDAMVVRDSHPLLQNTPEKRRLSSIVYALGSSALVGTICAGDWVVRDGRHCRQKQLDELSKSWKAL